MDRDFANAVEKWQAANVGGEFRLGDGIRSESNASALLELNEGSKLKLTQNSQVRFMTVTNKQGESGHGIDVATGKAELIVGDADFTLLTSVGSAIIDAGSVVRLKKTDEGMAFEVAIGKATYFDKNRSATEIGEGESISVDIGAAVIEKFTEKPAEEKETDMPQPADTPYETDETDDATKDQDEEDPHRGAAGGETTTIPDGPLKADFKVSPGATFVVHAPSPPIAIAFSTTDKCAASAAVRIGRQWVAKSVGDVSAVFEVGRHRYRIKCLEADGTLGADIAKGRIQVLADAGVAKIPGKPPTSFIETDGRRYRILYQTRQPRISVKWPKAPKGQKYTLHIDGKKAINTPKPAYNLSSGTLSEGIHRLQFEAIGSLARTSRTTIVEIRFDNAAPKASLTAPTDGSFGPGSIVQVKGTAMPNWEVKLLGGTVEKDEQHRFTGKIQYKGVYMAVTLRLSHAKRGVHYYIRRAQGQEL